MKQIALFILSILTTLAVDAQKKTYLDANRIQSSPEKAKYYRLITKEKDLNRVRVLEYLVDGNKLFTDYLYLTKSMQVKDGAYKTYYPNEGNLRDQGIYKEGKQVGLKTEFYSFGGKKAQYEFKETDRYCIQYWDKQGKPKLQDGNGTFSEKREKDGVEIYYEYKNHKLYCSYELLEDGQKLYHSTEVKAIYKGGMPAFYRFIGERMIYPKAARRQEIDGVVFVKFNVNTDGHVDYISIVKGIHVDCDREVKRVVSMTMASWVPAMHNGEKVKSTLVFPVVFRLN
ncbi:energy transducer TonB [Reichenbachiella versicolor]|uniref:energy transducer TonB n=1 Tax=Reichenbachiella versicolor TaxID=1821036 RepID=UPI000D6DFBB1|nr:energy transducer TonB [Reichenbachiella versicolor]